MDFERLWTIAALFERSRALFAPYFLICSVEPNLKRAPLPGGTNVYLCILYINIYVYMYMHPGLDLHLHLCLGRGEDKGLALSCDGRF